MKSLVFAAVLICASFQSVFAQQHSGTDSDEQACIRDVTRFCRKLITQGDFAILGCLKQNRSHLRRSCLKVLTDHGQ